MVTIRQERTADLGAREALLEAAYGPTRFRKPSARLRSGRKPAAGLSLVAVEGRAIVGSVRLWEVSGGTAGPVLLLGPLAVHPDFRRRGIGSALMRHALRSAARRGHAAVLLVGDLAYYSRFGFSAERTGRLWLPGLADKGRLLGCELTADALKRARGAIRPPKRPARSPLVAAIAGLARPARPQAA